MRTMLRYVVVLALAGALTPAALGSAAAEAGPGPTPVLMVGAEGNRLVAYDTETGESAVALGSAADDPDRLDLNAQVCADPRNPGWFIAGEDTAQGSGDAADAPGWGYLRLHGTSLDDLDVTMAGNLVTTYANVTDNPENYGCGFLSDGRLVTTDVGDQQPAAAATGQLIVWFRGADGTFAGADHPHCKVDLDLPTAGGVHVDEHDRVYVAASRPGLPTNLDLAGIYRYTGLPTSLAQCSRRDATGAALVDAGVVSVERFITGDPLGALTPSAVVAKPGGGFYVSSVLTGVIAEHDADGRFVRRVLDPPLPFLLPPFPGGTPYGLAVAPDGSLWYADLGVELTLPAPGPGDGTGTVRRIAFADGRPLAPEIVRSGLDFPDGLGLVPLVDAALPAPTDPDATSRWGCGDWGMYGGNPERTFSTDCPSGITPVTAAALVPAWTRPMPRTVTAAPAVVDGTVYVGDWSGTMYALRLSDGSERWHHRTEPAPGAAFGPIVSSAAVADVDVGGATTRLVVFGAGPRLYALDAATGDPVWVLDESRGRVGTPTEIESSPVVHGGVVYVGVDTHGGDEAETGGVRGGLLAVDAATGAVRWRFHPELDQPGVGCGGVWSSPTIDVVEGTVLLATANCGADAAELTWTPHTEAVTALDLDDGDVRWSFQPHPPNRDDLDFGATPNLITLPSGARLVGVGNKDAVYYALDPATGEHVWSSQVALPGNLREGFAVGGFIGSTATWRGDVYGGTALGGPPWYHALHGDGTRKWSAAAGPTYAGSAVVNGVVLAGDLTGTFKAFHAASGLPLSVLPLLGPISSAPAVAGDTIVIGSGTSSSDLCAKGVPGSEVCFALFDATLGSVGAVTALRPATLGGLLGR